MLCQCQFTGFSLGLYPKADRFVGRNFEQLLQPKGVSFLALESRGMASLREAWGTFHVQADAHEFFGIFLDWAKPAHANQTWSRRLLTSSGPGM